MGEPTKEVIAAYRLVMGDVEEKDKFFRKNTKERLQELVVAFSDEMDQSMINETILRKDFHNR